MSDLVHHGLDELLTAVGAHLAAREATASIVVIGGAALVLHGWIDRATRDVDIVARVARPGDGRRTLVPPEPLPEALVDAVRTVARDYGLPRTWMNTGPAAQWKTGLPPGFSDEIEWRRHRALEVGIAGRRSLIALKLFAAVDQGPESVHYQDLTALGPEDEELTQAADWVTRQDASEIFARQVQEAVDHVQRYDRGDGEPGT